MTAEPQGQLSGLVALVTGAGRNIGRATAIRFAQEGAAVAVVWNRDEDRAAETCELVEQRGGRAVSVQMDLADEASIVDGVKRASSSLGPIDIVVNNAAIRPRQTLDQIEATDWDNTFAVNVRSGFLLAKATVPAMRSKGFGRILFLGGLHGYIGHTRGAHVSASKMAVVGLARALALEVAGSGITVNVVVPGTIDTVRGESVGDVRAVDQVRRLAAVPVGRIGTPDDVAGMCLFLASASGDYMTGQEFFVTGGAYPLVSL